MLQSEVIDGTILTVRLERPEIRNALSLSMIAELQVVIRSAEADGLRVVVLAGSGPAFCAGADLSSLRGDISDIGFDDALARLTEQMTSSPMIIVAALHGACIGAGLDLAMACDLRVAAADCRFSLPAVRVGILYSPASLERFFRSIAPASLARMLLLAEALDVNDARAAGIVTHTAGQMPLLDHAIELARRAASLPPEAQAASKKCFNQFLDGSFDRDAAQALRRETLQSDERRRALSHSQGARR